jgi:hypothetical protein
MSMITNSSLNMAGLPGVALPRHAYTRPTRNRMTERDGTMAIYPTAEQKQELMKGPADKPVLPRTDRNRLTSRPS